MPTGVETLPRRGNNPGSRIPNCRLCECRLQNAVCPNASNIKNLCFK